MTALEVGCRRMDSPITGTWSVVPTAEKIPFYDGSNTTVTQAFESILSPPSSSSPSSSSSTSNKITNKTDKKLCDTIVPYPPSRDVLSWSLKLNVRVVAYLTGLHTYQESIGTIVFPTLPPPPSSSSSYTDRMVSLFVKAAISVITKCRDVVWYGDVYEEEDLGMNYDRE
eukprot:CAMPEP_0118658026 /NCGR_PEP_ID=MMETSP0785-20121206/14339_1 /TAXON_ID=91992 /ORGANISM="Bolidomonas pacifica, Strain CCMP 1866" /LENGTH=169 /DNA_ID=CAMNT_0006550997 /DNA_START=31 /DNA_END=537 /DNA_ORIENTATION=+